MITVAICDDEEIYCRQIREKLTAFSIADSIDMDIKEYRSAEELIHAAQGGWTFQLLFLDIMMKDMNGMEAARKLREMDCGGLIVFITSYLDYMQTGYEVKAFRYLLKNQMEQQLGRVIGDCIRELGDGSVFTFQFEREIHRVRQKDILYMESEKRLIHLHAAGCEYIFYESLDGVLKQLEAGMFVRCHRSFLVNAGRIRRFTGTELELENGTVLPIGRKYSADVMKRLLL